MQKGKGSLELIELKSRVARQRQAALFRQGMWNVKLFQFGLVTLEVMQQLPSEGFRPWYVKMYGPKKPNEETCRFLLSESCPSVKRWNVIETDARALHCWEESDST